MCFGRGKQEKKEIFFFLYVFVTICESLKDINTFHALFEDMLSLPLL